MSDHSIYVMPARERDEWDKKIAHVGQNVFSSFRYNLCAISGKDDFFVLRNDGDAHPVVFFRMLPHRVEILHLYSRFSSAEIRSICQLIFDMFAHVRSIGFECIESGFGPVGFVVQQYNFSEDFVVDLCGSVEQYSNRLGKQLRSDLKRFRKKLYSEFSDVRYECVCGQEASESAFNEIIGFSASRMAIKLATSSHTMERSRRLFELVKSFGLLFLIYIDGKVRAGVICTLYGNDMFMHVVAHDPRFDRFRLGKLACYGSICAAIERGAVRYHLLSGWYDYKVRFLGRQVEFDRLEVYRSIGSGFLACDRYLYIFFRGNGRRVKRYLRSRGITTPGWLSQAHAVRMVLGRMAAPVRWLGRLRRRS